MEIEDREVIMRDANGKVTFDMARARIISFYLDDDCRLTARRLATQAIIHELDEDGGLVRESIDMLEQSWASE